MAYGGQLGLRSFHEEGLRPTPATALLALTKMWRSVVKRCHQMGAWKEIPFRRRSETEYALLFSLADTIRTLHSGAHGASSMEKA
jgi:hypothetical protein